ncbi:MAG: PAS domain-containing protein [Alphaproteobacteria bacterium]|nr:MAG: PAS domain-containing protein [Alphaproteobacteria bacterium]
MRTDHIGEGYTMAHEGYAKRIGERLQHYWESSRGDRTMPFESDIDTSQLEDVWDACFLIRVDEGNAPRYVYMGTQLVEAYGDDIQARDVCERLAYPASTTMLHRIDEVISSKAIQYQEGEFINASGLRVCHRSILLPMATEHKPEDVAFILGGMRWKYYL